MNLLADPNTVQDTSLLALSLIMLTVGVAFGWLVARYISNEQWNNNN